MWSHGYMMINLSHLPGSHDHWLYVLSFSLNIFIMLPKILGQDFLELGPITIPSAVFSHFGVIPTVPYRSQRGDTSIWELILPLERKRCAQAHRGGLLTFLFFISCVPLMVVSSLNYSEPFLLLLSWPLTSAMSFDQLQHNLCKKPPRFLFQTCLKVFESLKFLLPFFTSWHCPGYGQTWAGISLRSAFCLMHFYTLVVTVYQCI